ncbi:MAG: aminopeptidase [Gemmatimonadetes bacterium]|nr:aminopeptidase [Gemmatimonadota bacterium]
MRGPNRPPVSGGRGGRGRRWGVGLLVVTGLLASIAATTLATGCSPRYVLRAGWEEAKILNGRRSLPEVILDPATDAETRGKLTLAYEAREFARDSLLLDVGDSYTTYTKLERDTLAMVLSAARSDSLAPVTWWFPIVGHVPYRGFFDLADAEREQLKLEAEGFDTYLRPTAAFSTLGWFSDPLLSTIVRYDEVELVATIMHELAHNHLFVAGQIRFNESFATWVGRRAAIAFFCSPAGGGPESALCAQARDRWEDMMLYSRYIDGLVAELEEHYADESTTTKAKIARRDEVFLRHREHFQREIRPRLRSLTFANYDDKPPNNAILLSRMRYYHRLPDFDRHLALHGGSLPRALATFEAAADVLDDLFEALPARALPARRCP